MSSNEVNKVSVTIVSLLDIYFAAFALWHPI